MADGEDLTPSSPSPTRRGGNASSPSLAEPVLSLPKEKGAGGLGEIHGGPNEAELASLGLWPEDVLDFSASTNPFGPPPGVIEALAACDVTRYPDRRATRLREALARHEGVSPDQVIVGGGATQLIWAIAAAFLRPGDTALVFGPTFGEYAAAGRLMDAQIVACNAPGAGEAPGAWPRAARIAWLCNPNNPTGVYRDAAEVAWLRKAAPAALWVLDEAYRPFVTEPWDSRSLLADGKTILLRSLTKDCALPGLRLGYALAAATIVAALDRALPPWSVSAPAIAAGLAALRSYAAVRASLLALRAETAWLRAALLERGWRVSSSATNFLLIEVGDAAALRQRLLAEHRIQVRNCASFGMPDFIRIGTRTRPENERLLVALGAYR